MRRYWEIDALRGLMLLLMTVTHLPSRLTDPLGQPFGFVSAAEGFVLLSAFVCGQHYGRIGLVQGIEPMRRAFRRRALTIWLVQAATLQSLFAAAGRGVGGPAGHGLGRGAIDRATAVDGGAQRGGVTAVRVRTQRLLRPIP
jgi:peptidoglycan/LPS O-acetylase OafA/YrhL